MNTYFVRRIKLTDLSSNPLLFMGWGSNDLEGANELLINIHDGPCVVKLTAIIWRREQGDESSAGLKLVPILDYLMGSTNQVQIVLCQKLGQHIWSESIRHTSTYGIIIMNNINDYCYHNNNNRCCLSSCIIIYLADTSQPLPFGSGSLHKRSHNKPR